MSWNEPGYSCRYLDEALAAVDKFKNEVESAINDIDISDQIEKARDINEQLRSENNRLSAKVDQLEGMLEEAQELNSEQARVIVAQQIELEGYKELLKEVKDETG